MRRTKYMRGVGHYEWGETASRENFRTPVSYDPRRYHNSPYKTWRTIVVVHGARWAFLDKDKSNLAFTNFLEAVKGDA